MTLTGFWSVYWVITGLILLAAGVAQLIGWKPKAHALLYIAVAHLLLGSP